MNDRRRSQANPLLQLSRLGQNLWYDNVTRDLLVAQTGIDLATVPQELEDDGVAKFAASYASVLAGIEAKVGALAAR